MAPRCPGSAARGIRPAARVRELWSHDNGSSPPRDIDLTDASVLTVAPERSNADEVVHPAAGVLRLALTALAETRAAQDVMRLAARGARFVTETIHAGAATGFARMDPMDEDLEALSRDRLVEEVKRLRAGVRAHRDRTKHELCWHHPELWGLLPDRTDPKPTVPSWPEFLRGCVAYRQSLDRELADAPRTDEPYRPS